jgi:hypothetical protein
LKRGLIEAAKAQGISASRWLAQVVDRALADLANDDAKKRRKAVQIVVGEDVELKVIRKKER